MIVRNESVSPCPVPELTPQVYACWRASELGSLTEALERQLILEGLGDVSGKSVLEIGCGDGDFAVTLAKRGAHVTAIDASEDMIAAARRRASEQHADVWFGVAAAQALPFDDERFDIVVAMTILCFVKDATPVFHEIARVLRPGGYLVIGELGKWSWWALERRLRAWFGSSLWKRGVFRTPNQLSGLARNVGLIPAGVQGAVYYPRWSWAARLLAPMDSRIGQFTHYGAAFLALKATKPSKVE